MAHIGANRWRYRPVYPDYTYREAVARIKVERHIGLGLVDGDCLQKGNVWSVWRDSKLLCEAGRDGTTNAICNVDQQQLTLGTLRQIDSSTALEHTDGRFLPTPGFGPRR